MAVSLDEILACRSLLAALQTCMRAKQNRPPQVAQPAAQLLGEGLVPFSSKACSPAECWAVDSDQQRDLFRAEPLLCVPYVLRLGSESCELACLAHWAIYCCGCSQALH